MQFLVKNGDIEKQRTACLIIGVYEENKLYPAAKSLNANSRRYIQSLLKTGDLKVALGQTLLIHKPIELNCERLLLVSCGKDKSLSEADYRKLVTATASALKTTAAKDALCCLTELPVKERDIAWKAQQATQAMGNLQYSFDQLKSDKKKDIPSLKKLTYLTANQTEAKQAKQGVDEGIAINAGINEAKDLSNLPGNVCTPTYLAKRARALGKKYPAIKTSVLEEKAMEKLGMGALLSVSRGSRQPAKLIVMEYEGQGCPSAARGRKPGAADGSNKNKKKQKPVVLVGKGLTFDAGGISIKPSAGMDEMKYDMCGAASVFGALIAAAELKLPINIVGIVPSSENLPDGDANKPGDVVTSMAGHTIEILNTDAEGRLILCDALTYSKKFDPDVVVDVATLTGACIVALGHHTSAVLGNDNLLIQSLLDAGETSADRAWQLPMGDEYQEQLKSNFADLANIGGPGAGSITAACFLSRFTEDYRWAHLDIAGTAWKSGAAKGATGRPVPLLVQYLINKAKNAR